MPQNEFPKTLTRKQLSNLSGDYFYFLSPIGMGDTYYLCALKRALETKLSRNDKNKETKCEIVLIIQPYHAIVLECFGIKKYIICENLKRNDYLLDLPNIAYEPMRSKILPAYFTPLNKDYLIRDCQKKSFLDLFNLPYSTKIDFPSAIPTLESALRKRLESIAPLEKIVLYLPEANGTRSLPLAIFRADCQRLQNEGYTIIVNAVKSEQYNAFGARNLNLSLRQAVALSVECAFVIGMRSGFMDIIAAQCKHISAYYLDMGWLDICSLQRNGLSERVKELTIKARFFGLGGLERSIAYRFYKRLIMRGVWRRLKCPLALMRLYLRYKDSQTPSVENPAVLESYEYQLGLAVLGIYKAHFNPLEIARFLRDYPRIRRLPRLKTFALAHYRAHFK